MGQPDKVGYGTLLRDRSFSLFFSGQILTNMGDGLFAVALTFLTLRMDATPFELGFITFCSLLPRVLLGPVGGVIADRVDRRKLMVTADIVRFLLVLLIPILFNAGLLEMWSLALFACLLNSFSPILFPASKSLIPQLVGKDRLELANGLVQTIVWPSFFLGTGLVGALQWLLGFPDLLFVNAVVFLCSATAVFFMKVQPQERNESSVANASFWSNLRQGYHALKENRPLFARVMTYSIYTFFWRGLLQIGMPLFVTVQLDGDAGLFGIFMVLNGVGEMVSSLALGKMRFQNPTIVSFTGEILFGVAALGIALSLLLPGAVLFVSGFVFLIGVSTTLIDIPLVTTIQRQVPSDHIAKVFAYWSTMGSLGSSLGTLSMGKLLELVAIDRGFVISGFVLFATGVIGTAWAVRYFARNKQSDASAMHS